MKKVILLCSLAVAATPVFAQDAGVPDDAGMETTGCGDVTVQGLCEGNVLKYCGQGDELVTADCSTEYFPEDITSGTCVMIDDQYGYDCALPTNEPCAFQGQQGLIPTFCSVPTDGCVVDFASEAGFVCTPNVPACTQADPYPPTCNGDLLYVGCLPGDQPLAFDCASAGGTCASGACEIAEGGQCDGQTFVCASGTTCEGATQQSLGVCTAGSSTDPGTNPNPNPTPGGDDTNNNDDTSDRDDPEEPAPSSGFGCSATTGSAPIFGLALVALAMIRRRRR